VLRGMPELFRGSTPALARGSEQRGRRGARRPQPLEHVTAPLGELRPHPLVPPVAPPGAGRGSLGYKLLGCQRSRLYSGRSAGERLQPLPPLVAARGAGPGGAQDLLSAHGQAPRAVGPLRRKGGELPGPEGRLR